MTLSMIATHYISNAMEKHHSTKFINVMENTIGHR